MLCGALPSLVICCIRLGFALQFVGFAAVLFADLMLSVVPVERLVCSFSLFVLYILFSAFL